MRPPRRIFTRAQQRHMTRRLYWALPLLGVTASVIILSAGESRMSFPTRIIAVPSRVAVLDGATLRVGETAIGLAGIADARPEAARTLESIVRDRKVECQIRAPEEGGLPQGVCRAGGVDLSRALVESGWATARPSAPVLLVSAEQTARERHRGVWAAQ